MTEAVHSSKSTPVADDWNWTARIRNELGANKAWQRNWGFLVEPKPGDGQPPAAGAGLAGQPAAADSLAAFMKQASQPGSSPTSSLSYIAGKQRESARARRLEQQDSLDGFVSTYMVKGDPKARQLPNKEFRQPLVTSHEYGWGRNLEVFGNMALVMK